MWKKDKQSNDEWVWGTAYIHMGSSIYSIPFFVSLAKWFRYILRQGHVEESIQVCESWGGGPMSLEDVSDSWVVPSLSWSGSCTHIFSGRPNKTHAISLVMYGFHHFVFHLSFVNSIKNRFLFEVVVVNL